MFPVHSPPSTIPSSIRQLVETWGKFRKQEPGQHSTYVRMYYKRSEVGSCLRGGRKRRKRKRRRKEEEDLVDAGRLDSQKAQEFKALYELP